MLIVFGILLVLCEVGMLLLHKNLKTRYNLPLKIKWYSFIPIFGQLWSVVAWAVMVVIYNETSSYSK